MVLKRYESGMRVVMSMGARLVCACVYMRSGDRHATVLKLKSLKIMLYALKSYALCKSVAV